VHWAEFALGPDAQCAWPTPAASARPTRTARVRPMASRGTARVHSASAAHGLGQAARAARGARHTTRARAVHGGTRCGGAARRAGNDTAPAHGRRRGWRLTSAETATGDGGHGPGDAASDHGGRDASCRDDGVAREASVGTRREGRGCRARRGRGSCRDAWRAVPTAALNRCVGAARDD
jgi:hypothetical protein